MDWTCDYVSSTGKARRGVLVPVWRNRENRREYRYWVYERDVTRAMGLRGGATNSRRRKEPAGSEKEKNVKGKLSSES